MVIPGVGVGSRCRRRLCSTCGTAVGAVAVRASVDSAPGAVAIRFPLSQAHYFNALTGERLRTLGAKLV